MGGSLRVRPVGAVLLSAILVLATWTVADRAEAASDSFLSRSGDFDGDGRDDVVAFTRGSDADVYVALSRPVTPTPPQPPFSTFSNPSLWHDSFVTDDDLPLLGDFNGDGKDDIVAFTRDASVNTSVRVALSTGKYFGGATTWHPSFATAENEIAAVGDVNGDGRDDIVAFTRDPDLGWDVWVALSTGQSFGGPTLWRFDFDYGYPAVGDFDGDGRDDIVSRNNLGVWVAVSTGKSFIAPAKWHDSIGRGSSAVGDFDGDGRDDIVTFRFPDDVFVSLSVSPSRVGGSFGIPKKWHDNFEYSARAVGDFDGDGRDDVAGYRNGTGEVHVFLATRYHLGADELWTTTLIPFQGFQNGTIFLGLIYL